MTNAPEQVSEPLILLSGAPLNSLRQVSRYFPGYAVKPLIAGLISSRTKRIWSGLVSGGQKIIVAVWEEQPTEVAWALAKELGLPLHRLERGILSNIGPFKNKADCLGLYKILPNGRLDFKNLLNDASYQEDFSRWRQVSTDLLALTRKLRLFFTPKAAEIGCPEISKPKRILILGSNCGVKAEQSLICLAAMENPEAVFFYQSLKHEPSPPVFKEIRLQLPGCRLLKAHQTWPDVEKVYTVDSPSGAIAIMAGLKVTVSGNPYYAGLGLTDDRPPAIGGEYNIDAAELFYLLCLRTCGYAASPRDVVRGCLASILTLSAEQFQAKLEIKKQTLPKWLKYSMRTDFFNLNSKTAESRIGYILRSALAKRIRNFMLSETGLSVLNKTLSVGVQGRSISVELKQPKRQMLLANKCFQKRHLALSYNCCLSLLRGGYLTAETLRLIIKVANLRFDFEMALSMSLFAGQCFPQWRKGWFFLSASQQALLCGQTEDSLKLLAHCFLNHKMTAEIPFPGHENKLNDIYGLLPWQKAITSAKIARQQQKKLSNARSLLYAEDFDEALQQYEKRGDANYILLRAQVLRLNGCYLKARELIEKLLQKYPDPRTFNEALSLSLNFDDDWSARLWAKADSKKMKINSFTAWQVLNKLGQLKEAFIRHCQAPYFNHLKVYLRNKLHTTGPLPDKKTMKQTLVLSECFLGDELRFSRLYPAIAKIMPGERLVFSCDPRIHELMLRSFPDLHFSPVSKKNSLSQIRNFDEFKHLPGSDCSSYLDNKGWELAQKSDMVITVMHALPSVLPNYSALDKLPDLKCDLTKSAELKTILKSKAPRGSLIAGLSWRSHLLRYDRNSSNFSLSQLAPLLEMEGIQWVNCQYDGFTEAEKNFLNINFPNRVINLEEVDQYDNIEETAALYYALDVMVSSPTYCADLAGSLGRKTLLFTKHSSIMSWARPGTNRHAFMPEVELFASQPDRDINQLSPKLIQRLWEIQAELCKA